AILRSSPGKRLTPANCSEAPMRRNTSTAIVDTTVLALMISLASVHRAEARRWGWGWGIGGGIATALILGGIYRHHRHYYSGYSYRPRYAYYGHRPYYGYRYYRPRYAVAGYGYWRPRWRHWRW